MAYAEPPYRPRRSPPDTSTDLLDIGKWTAAFALFLALLALLTSLQLFQLTAEGASKRTLRRSIAALTEIDPLIDRGYDELQRGAQDAAPGETVELRDFPIAVPLTPAEVEGRSKQQIRDLLLDRASGVVYEDGAGSLRDATADDGSAGRFSMAGLTKHALGFLRSRNHNILAGTTIGLAILSAVLALALAATCHGFGRLTSIALVVMTAAAPVAVGGIGARFSMRIMAEGDPEYVQSEFLAIGRGLAWIPIRDGAAFSLFGLALLVVGYACARWSDRSHTRSMTMKGAPL